MSTEDHTCGTCKFRGTEDDEEFGGDSLPPGYFLCLMIRDPRTHKQRTKDGTWNSKGLGAIVKDASGYHAALCVQSTESIAPWSSISSPA